MVIALTLIPKMSMEAAAQVLRATRQAAGGPARSGVVRLMLSAQAASTELPGPLAPTFKREIVEGTRLAIDSRGQSAASCSLQHITPAWSRRLNSRTQWHVCGR